MKTKRSSVEGKISFLFPLLDDDHKVEGAHDEGCGQEEHGDDLDRVEEGVG